MGREGFRVASVRVPVEGDQAAYRLGAALLAASPRVAVAGPGLCRVDARGWERRGGEEALARACRGAAEEAGFEEVRMGVADAAVAADAAAALAASDPVVVPPGRDRAFLAPLPLAFLPLPAELRETFRALGIVRIEQVARLERAEIESRFGPEGVRARRLARGEDDRMFRPLTSPELPAAGMELQGAVAELEPLLFVLRHLLGRICEELAGEARCAARLELELALEGAGRSSGSGAGPRERAPETSLRLPVVPARPTAREATLFDLCRAILERELGSGAPSSGASRRGRPATDRSDRPGRVEGPVAALALRVVEAAPAETRQGDLFGGGWRDPLATAATLSRLRARVGEEGVVRPAPRPAHRPETRNGWTPVEARDRSATEESAGERADPRVESDPARRKSVRLARRSPITPALRLLPRPTLLEVRVEEGRPVSIRDGEGRRRVTAAEGPERLSGDWWKAAYGREYWRLATADGELLWVFRERREEEARWWLHGWWD